MYGWYHDFMNWWTLNVLRPYLGMHQCKTCWSFISKWIRIAISICYKIAKWFNFRLALFRGSHMWLRGRYGWNVSLRRNLSHHWWPSPKQRVCQTRFIANVFMWNVWLLWPICISSELHRNDFLLQCFFFFFGFLTFSNQVGLPAKSGVSGILMVVVPNVMGFAMWSPPLDKLGNSVRGVHFCTVTSAQFTVSWLTSLNYCYFIGAGVPV